MNKPQKIFFIFLWLLLPIITIFIPAIYPLLFFEALVGGAYGIGALWLWLGKRYD